MEKELLDITSGSLPKAFVKSVMREVELICSDSYEQVIAKTSIGKYGAPEAEWILGYERRALWEKRLRDLAEQFGLTATVESNDQGNHEFTQICAGRLRITSSHKLGPDYFMLRNSIFRESNARLNAVLNQRLFPFMPDESRNDDGGVINAVIFYKVSEDEKDNVDYLRLGFPSEDNRRWAHKVDFYDILENYSVERQAEEDRDLLIRWKRKIGVGSE